VRALVAAALLLAAAAAEGAERRMLDAGEAAEFRGVGRLNVAGTRFCTAALIRPDVIVTAAHCLYHPRTHARVPESEMTFVAGLRLGQTAAVRKVTRAVAEPRFDFAGAADPAGVTADLAVLALDRPVPGEAAAAFATAEWAAEAGPVAVVSYARDRAQAPSIEDCEVRARFGDAAAIDCAVTYGASGAPVLQDGRVVGVVSAMGRSLEGGREVTLAALVGLRIASMLAVLDTE
jgi:V8-like Glu-specific endopeptidase